MYFVGVDFNNKEVCQYKNEIIISTPIIFYQSFFPPTDVCSSCEACGWCGSPDCGGDDCDCACIGDCD